MAELTITERQAGDVAILDLEGRINSLEGSVQLRDAVRALLDAGQRKILLNFAAVAYIDSSGVDELMSAYATSSNQGGVLKLLNLPPQILDGL